MKWTKEHYDYILSICNGKPVKEILALFNEHFNENITFSAISNAMYKCGAKTNVNGGRFKKGDKPFNKGLKWDEYLSKESQESCRRTCYKKGDTVREKNNKWTEIGTETLWKGEYFYIKVDKPTNRKGHMYHALKHRYIWEQHNGPIPEGYVVIFLDGNRQNFNIDNLALVKRSELAMLNREKLIVKDNKEATKCGIAIVKLEERIKEYEKQAD